MILIYSFILGILFAVAGCIPIPTKINTMPNVNGSITIDGKSSASIPIKLCTHFYGEINCRETVTNEQGNFYITPKSKLGFISFGDPQHGYKLSIQKEGQELGWTYGRIGQIPAEANIICNVSEKLICELNSK